MWRIFWTTVLLAVAAKASLSRNLFKRDAKDHDNGDHWSYEDKFGPEFWGKSYPKCSGNRQSPVDIDTDDVDLNEELDEIDFDNYNKPLKKATLKNNGHTVVLTPGTGDPVLKISDGGLDDMYKFVQLHFHWGSDSKKGSEHTIDDKAYPLEMHLVHMNTEYSSMTEAIKKPDGLAVLGVLFEVDDEDNDAFEPIIDKLNKIKKEGATVPVDELELDELLPDDMMPYYRYEGSLTTPPCSEAVIWTVFKEPVEISEKQLEQFRNLKEEEAHEGEEPLVNNFRPTQELHGRAIEVSGNAAVHLTASLLLALTSVAITRFF